MPCSGKILDGSWIWAAKSLGPAPVGWTNLRAVW